MKPALLDLNVLVALTWPSHVHHAAAHRWYSENKSYGWASCPITQSGLVRISSNPKIIQDAVSPPAALALLEQLCDQAEHEFWPDDISLMSGAIFKECCLLGHRQITDAYLLSLAIHRDARLATFDAALTKLAPQFAKHVCLIEP